MDAFTAFLFSNIHGHDMDVLLIFPYSIDKIMARKFIFRKRTLHVPSTNVCGPPCCNIVNENRIITCGGGFSLGSCIFFGPTAQSNSAFSKLRCALFQAPDQIQRGSREKEMTRSEGPL